LNPFTQSLLAQLDAPPEAEFVRAWDALEQLVIAVFRAKRASPEQEEAHASLRAALTTQYGRWEEALAPYWQRAKVKGHGKQRPQRATEDPFAFLLACETAGDFARSREAFVMLPAAREALNTYLLAQIDGAPAATS